MLSPKRITLSVQRMSLREQVLSTLLEASIPESCLLVLFSEPCAGSGALVRCESPVCGAVGCLWRGPAAEQFPSMYSALNVILNAVESCQRAWSA